MTNIYIIDTEVDTFYFEHKGSQDLLEILERNNKTYYYEAGDDYLYNAPEGGKSYFLGKVYNFGFDN